MPFCDQCGSAITAGARFCDECGAPAVAEQNQTAAQSITASKPTERAPLDTQAMWYAAAGALLAAFIGIMASYLIVETATDAILETMPTGGFSEQLKSNTFKFGALNYYGGRRVEVLRTPEEVERFFAGGGFFTPDRRARMVPVAWNGRAAGVPSDLSRGRIRGTPPAISDFPACPMRATTRSRRWCHRSTRSRLPSRSSLRISPV